MRRMSIAAAVLLATGGDASAGITVGVADLAFDHNDLASSSATIHLNASGLMRAYGGFPDLSLASFNNRAALFDFSISQFNGLQFDHVYLSMTEIRSYPNLSGNVNIYANDGSFPSQILQSITVDVATQQAFNSNLTLVGSVQGTGVAGNHLLLDVTSAILSAMSANSTYLGLLLRDDFNDGLAVGILGKNYNSGDATQYYASSLYEYPTLIATLGEGITPFDQLPSRPITNEPLGPPPSPPTPPSAAVPEPASLALWGIGLVGLVLGRLLPRRKPTTVLGHAFNLTG